MGRLLSGHIDNTNFDKSKCRTKGQRLGWSHKSDAESFSLRSMSSQGKTLSTYTVGPYSVNKLVP